MRRWIGLLLIMAGAGFFVWNWGFTKPVANTDTINERQQTMPSATPSEQKALTLSVSGFGNGESIPSKFTCDGDDISPQIEWSGVPEDTESLVLIMEDRDIPKNLRSDGLFVHWILYSIPASEKGIAEGGSVGSPGLNTLNKAEYMGPCPPPQYEPAEHRYYFTLYALDIAPLFDVAPNKETVVNMMQGHILGQTEYMGRYKRK